MVQLGHKPIFFFFFNISKFYLNGKIQLLIAVWFDNNRNQSHLQDFTLVHVQLQANNISIQIRGSILQAQTSNQVRLSDSTTLVELLRSNGMVRVSFMHETSNRHFEILSIQPLKRRSSDAKSCWIGYESTFRSSENAVALQSHWRPRYHDNSGYFHPRNHPHAGEHSQVQNSLRNSEKSPDSNPFPLFPPWFCTSLRVAFSFAGPQERACGLVTLMYQLP